MAGDRRHDEEAYQNLRTLEALTEVDTTARRVYALLRLMTRIRQERPLLWHEITRFRRTE